MSEAFHRPHRQCQWDVDKPQRDLLPDASHNAQKGSNEVGPKQGDARSCVVMPEMTGGVMGVLAQLNGAGREKLQENMNSIGCECEWKRGSFDGCVLCTFLRRR